MKEVVIVSGVRTAVGAFGGALKDVSAIDLGALVIKETLKKVGLRPVADEALKEFAPDKLKDQGMIELEKRYHDYDTALSPVSIDEVVMGNVVQAGQGQNPARQATIRSGIPKETPAATINKVCSSGLRSIAMGAQSIMLGEADVVVAGGMESMSNIPFTLPSARWGYRMALTGVADVIDLMVYDGLYEIFYGYHMGITAENIVQLYGISREEQDQLSVLSHTRARQAIVDGTFKEEIVPVVIKGRKEDIIVDTDERPMDTSMDKLAKMKPAFKKDGSVTAGNASGINDGAAAVLLMSADKAKAMGLEPYVKIKGFATGAIDPAYMGLGPIPAVRKLLKQNGLSVGDIDCWEVNEAFAAQALACIKELGLASDKPNELGSGISLGHPIGCTGARQVVTGMRQMKRKGYKRGIVTMCIGGGMGYAMLMER
ncbi:MAG: acetyl-CoA C-acetyltransferase [Nitrospirae bacterium]|uniref:thiolase family protein n=1 Tax=Candidatus Magnetobacterium casense TaxID=1455061 RepID=UPI00058E6671|nr:acetyl-CoA C-acetyltransferase [Candidatus Magnetobacterium casensis]MBF0338716.1 acetyl-CoA C-acetyltransferase [Nitrospirota bacterium]